MIMNKEQMSEKEFTLSNASWIFIIGFVLGLCTGLAIWG